MRDGGEEERKELKDLSHSQSAAVHSKSINIKNETWLCSKRKKKILIAMEWVEMKFLSREAHSGKTAFLKSFFLPFKMNSRRRRWIEQTAVFLFTLSLRRKGYLLNDEKKWERRWRKIIKAIHFRGGKDFYQFWGDFEDLLLEKFFRVKEEDTKSF